jgi:peptidoglycan hydrolase-like protein with peptidoglycan-binding domain
MFAVGALFFAGPALANPQQAGVQVALRAMGLYTGPIDGEVGPLTRAAVAKAQTRAGLPATGRIDTRTRDALGPLARPLFGKRPIEPGDFGLDVSVLQFLLARAGLYKAALDGYFGPHLERSVRAFQKRSGLAMDGVAGPETLRVLVTDTHVHRPPPRRVYVVQPGDSLTGIAQHFGIGLSSLAHVNRLDPAHTLLIGTKLTVPVTNAAPTVETGLTSPAPAPALTATPATVRDQLDLWSNRLGVSASLVRALAWMESGYQPNVVSDVGARGVLQTLPETRDWVEQVLLGHAVPETVDGDIEVGVLFLRHLLQDFNGDTSLALAAWYQGPAAVRQFGVYKVTKPFIADVLALQERM